MVKGFHFFVHFSLENSFRVGGFAEISQRVCFGSTVRPLRWNSAQAAGHVDRWVDKGQG